MACHSFQVSGKGEQPRSESSFSFDRLGYRTLMNGGGNRSLANGLECHAAVGRVFDYVFLNIVSNSRSFGFLWPSLH